MSRHGMTIDLDPALLNRRAINLAKMPDRQFAVNAKDDDGKKKAEMLIYDFIGADFFGEGVTAKRVEQELAALGEIDELLVMINSPGGVIYEALGIYNALARFSATVITHNVGAAWSAASWILQAGDERLMSENATFMAHNAQGLAIGDRRTMTKEAEILEMLDGTMAATYAKRSGRKAETFRKLMDEETWLDAAEALENKLIDKAVPAKSGAKNLDPAAFGFNMRRQEQTVDAEAAPEFSDKGKRARLVALELEAG